MKEGPEHKRSAHKYFLRGHICSANLFFAIISNSATLRLQFCRDIHHHHVLFVQHNHWENDAKRCPDMLVMESYMRAQGSFLACKKLYRQARTQDTGMGVQRMPQRAQRKLDPDWTTDLYVTVSEEPINISIS